MRRERTLPETRALLEAVRDAEQPSLADEERVKRALDASIASGVTAHWLKYPLLDGATSDTPLDGASADTPLDGARAARGDAFDEMSGGPGAGAVSGAGTRAVSGGGAGAVGGAGASAVGGPLGILLFCATAMFGTGEGGVGPRYTSPADTATSHLSHEMATNVEESPSGARASAEDSDRSPLWGGRGFPGGAHELHSSAPPSVRERPASERAAPSARAGAAPPRATPSEPREPDTSPVVQPAPARPARARPSPAHERRSAQRTLRAELDVLERARAALRRGDGASALRELEAYRGDGQLLAERRAARILALCAAGRSEAARRAAVEFSMAHPDSVQREAVERSCANSSRNDAARVIAPHDPREHLEESSE